MSRSSGFRRRSSDRHRPFHRKRFDHGEPISRIDTRPMAIFAVCLVAFAAIFYKPQTHAILIDLPLLSTATTAQIAAPSVTHTIRLDRHGRLSLNDNALDDRSLIRTLEALRSERTWPIVRFIPDANSAYGRVFEVLGVLDRHGFTNSDFCFAEMHRYARYSDTSDSVLNMMTVVVPALPLEEELCNPPVNAQPARLR